MCLCLRSVILCCSSQETYYESQMRYGFFFSRNTFKKMPLSESFFVHSNAFTDMFQGKTNVRRKRQRSTSDLDVKKQSKDDEKREHYLYTERQKVREIEIREKTLSSKSVNELLYNKKRSVSRKCPCYLFPQSSSLISVFFFIR